ncbi:Translation factor SUA5 [Syntrophobacter sp. SbD1]|nr:Translation factor SUA5 [Syntrophobacter sp. SbD1]
MSAPIGPETAIFKMEPGEVLKQAIYTAASILRAGGLVLYPTETFYALGAIPEFAQAVQKVFEAKGRDVRKPLPLIASDIQAVLTAASEWPQSADVLARSFWPGPLSIVVSAAASLPSVLHAQTGKVALRISSHPVASLLARASGGLIVSTSANRAGEPPPKDRGAIDRELLHAVDALLDAGELPGGLASTIVDVTVHPAVLIRAGKIAWEDIRRVLEG